MYECKSKPTFLRRLGQRVLLIFINQFPFLHKMDNLIVMCKHRNVEYLFNKSLQPILLTKVEKAHCFKLNNDDFEKFNKVLKKRKLFKVSKNANMQKIYEKISSLETLILQRIEADEKAGRSSEDSSDI